MNKSFFIYLAVLASIFLLSTPLWAQTPQGINYQAILSTENGPQTQLVDLRFEIYDGDSLVYSESHLALQPDTVSGVINVVIGSGVPDGISLFSDINWATGSYELVTSFSQNGLPFTTFAPTPLQSVPYSLFAAEAGSVPSMTLGDLANVEAAQPSQNQVLVWNGTNWIPQDPVNNSPWNTTSTGIAYDSGRVNLGATTWQLRLDNTGPSGIPFYFGSSNNNWAAGGRKFIIDDDNNSSNPIIAINSVNDNVGFGTSDPGAGIEVANDDIIVTDDGNLSVRLMHNYTGSAGGILVYGENGQPRIELQAQETASQGAEINLRDNEGNQSIILDADYLGNGRITTDELQIVGGSDFSENFDIIKQPEFTPKAGMLVSIDPNSTGKLVISKEAYDHKVAGVISGANGIKPGMIMGQQGSIANGEFPVALTGRVYVWADARYGAIEAGDLLTSSPSPGYAQKVRDHGRAHGAIIGKAMTQLKEGQGFILVLINLQ